MTDMSKMREMARDLVRESIMEDAMAQFLAQTLAFVHDDRIKPLQARIEALERERVLDAKLLADTQALLDKAVAALRGRMHCHDCTCGECDHIRAVLAEIEGGKKDE